MSLNRMGGGAPSCRVVTAARRLPWRGNGIVPGVRPQEAAFKPRKPQWLALTRFGFGAP